MKRSIFFIVGILLILVLIYAYLFDTKASSVSLELVVEPNNEKIRCLKIDEDWFAFLPSYAQLNDLEFSLPKGQDIWIDDIRISDGMKCNIFSIDTPYPFRYSTGGESFSSRITLLRSENVASMHVDTTMGAIEYLHSKKGNKDTGNTRLYTAAGTLDFAGVISAIQGRGNATWTNFEKKPYSLELSQEADLLGMGKACKWVLIANAADPSLIRNKLAFDFANDINLSYSPECQWIDLYINGEYMGLYLLCERNEVDEQRVDISNENGVLVSLERIDRLRLQNYPHVQTESGSALRIHYPRLVDERVISDISERFQKVENIIMSDKEHLLSDTIDLVSWVKKYLIEEIFLSCDACCLSQYFYYEGNGKVYAGPVWDYDYSLGNYISWQCKNPDGLYAKRSWATSTLYTPWFANLYNNEAFYGMIQRLYTEICVDLIDAMIEYGVQCNRDLIEKAAYLNNVRWSITTSENDYRDIAVFLSERKNFLSSVWVDEKQYREVRIDPGFSDFYGYFSVEDGGYLTELPSLEEVEGYKFEGWFYEDTNMPFDINMPILQDVNIYASWSRQGKFDLIMDKVAILIPLSVIMFMGGVFALSDIRRMRKGG